MKKILASFLAMAFALAVTAQTPSNAVPINGSYVTNTYIVVHPYIPPPSALPTPPGSNPPAVVATGAPQATPLKYDPNISFRLNKDTKFFINDIVSVDNVVTGYIITVWNYTGDEKNKDKFYKDLKTTPDPNADLAALKKIIDDKNASVIAAQNEVKKRTDELTQTKTLSTEATATLDKARATFFAGSLYFDATKNLPVSGTKNGAPTPEVSDFLTTQAKAVSTATEESETSVDQQEELIKKSLNIPIVEGSAFAKIKSSYVKAKSDAVSAAQNLAAAQQSLTTATRALTASQTELLTAQTNYTTTSAQKGPEPKGTKFYDKKKRDVGMPDDANITGDTNPAVAYDALAYIDSWANGWQFYISANDFSTKTVMIYPYSLKFTWGFLTLPIKLRFDNPTRMGGEFNFEQNLNFGLTFGLKQQWVNTNDISMNYLLGISVVNVQLNDAQPISTANPSGVPATSTTAVSTSAGVMFQYTKFQIGIFGGLDFAGQHADHFPFQGRPWLGFAIGVSLFGEGQTSASTQTQKTN